MARIFITGSTEGLGRAAALDLLDEGHQVVLHARNPSRAADLGTLADRAYGVVVGDLSDAKETHALAEQLNALGRMDTVIHNAGIYIDSERVATSGGHPRTLAVNVLAPYVLTAEITRPDRLVHISSGMLSDGSTSLDDLDWTARRWSGVQAYCDSKLLVATLAFAVARRWPDVLSNVVDPGWVPTRMGGPSASDDLTLGRTTQVWLAGSDEPEAAVSGGYWFHRRRREPLPAVSDAAFQDALLDELHRLTGVRLP
ncbi:SDR family NAD(P)-dependent oxidoreductase [Streptomyces sp. NPDC102467]|uniref:SDR family NAD(P)-dependent oxidoreductase n=1 Tax=Streptomyces sp. NPDC102467 TaxID=3366179 RepID=UPI0037FE76E4